MAKVKNSPSKIKTILYCLLIAYFPLLTIGLYTSTSAPQDFLSLNMPFIIASTIIAAMMILFTSTMQKSQILSSRLFIAVAIINIFCFEVFLWVTLTHWWDFVLLQLALQKMCTAPEAITKYINDPTTFFNLLCRGY